MQQAFHAPVGRGFEAAPARHAVEVLGRLTDRDEELPRGRYIGRRIGCGRRRWPVRRRAFPHFEPGPCRGNVLQRLRANREIGTQDLAGIPQRRFEFRRDGRLVRTGVAPGREAPTEHGLGKGAEVRQHGRGSSPERKLRSSVHSRNNRCPSASRRSSIAPALTSAGAETTSPVGRTNPSHSRWAAMCGSGLATNHQVCVDTRQEKDEKGTERVS